MKIVIGAMVGAMIFASSSAFAQSAVATSGAPAPFVIGSADPNVIRAGTPLALKTTEALTTKGKKLKAGQRVNLETAEPMITNGVTVIPAGTPVTGEITDVRNKGMWGKSGRINARVLYMRVNGRQVRMTGNFDDKGTTGTAGVVGAIAVLPVAGFFVTGTSANIPIGAPVNGFIDEDLPIAFAGSAAPMPMAPVQAAPAAAPVLQQTSATKR